MLGLRHRQPLPTYRHPQEVRAFVDPHHQIAAGEFRKSRLLPDSSHNFTLPASLLSSNLPVSGINTDRVRTSHPAIVSRPSPPSLPSLPLLDVETSLGKRTAQLDLGKESDTNKLRELVNNVDVFLQAYRPGGLEKKGFGVQDVVDLRQGIVYAGLRAWGWEGPWAMRKGVSMSRVI